MSALTFLLSFNLTPVTLLCTYVISFTSDWLYPTSENREIVIALNAIGKDVGFAEITSDKGHDSFLLDVPDFLSAVKNFLKTSYKKINEKRI